MQISGLLRAREFGAQKQTGAHENAGERRSSFEGGAGLALVWVREQSGMGRPLDGEAFGREGAREATLQDGRLGSISSCPF